MGTGLVLRTATRSDLAPMYQVGCVAWEQWPRLFGRGPLAPHQFLELCSRPDAGQFVATYDDHIIGVGELYDLTTSRTAWIGAAIVPGPAAEDARELVVRQLVAHAFDDLGLRKVWGVHHGFSAPLFAGCPQPSVVEGCIPSSFRFESWSWDTTFSSITNPALTHAPAVLSGEDR